jgi:hypothetical protein
MLQPSRILQFKKKRAEELGENPWLPLGGGSCMIYIKKGFNLIKEEEGYRIDHDLRVYASCA